ncbi:hypothetical protein BX600DRAFT_443711 [Xylariales sp. PMI_506]|nr:hypothetical protein BX600DRAFT_443711 [Xylariales sp. PMI_506]
MRVFCMQAVRTITTAARFLPHHQQQPGRTSNMESDPGSIVTWYLSRNPKDWFVPPAGFDEDIRGRFSNAITEARSGRFDGWADTPEGSLALIILLDQFPRNIYRQSAESYSSDEQALGVATHAVARGLDAYAGRLHQMLFYLPFMHAEELLAQVACRLLISQLVSDCPKIFEHLDFIRMGASAAERHLACIQALGRFPKRNECLGRNTTTEEFRWLQKYPGGF